MTRLIPARFSETILSGSDGSEDADARSFADMSQAYIDQVEESIVEGEHSIITSRLPSCQQDAMCNR